MNAAKRNMETKSKAPDKNEHDMMAQNVLKCQLAAMMKV